MPFAPVRYGLELFISDGDRPYLVDSELNVRFSPPAVAATCLPQQAPALTLTPRKVGGTLRTATLLLAAELRSSQGGLNPCRCAITVPR